MEINSVRESLNPKFNLTNTSKLTVSSRFYESSEAPCKPCQKSSGQGCCLKDFFIKLKEIITYPFIKLYELIFGNSSNKKEEKSKEGTGSESEDESNPIESGDEENDPKIDKSQYNTDYFFELGKNNQDFNVAGSNEEEQQAIIHAITHDNGNTLAYNRGLAYFEGYNGLPLRAEFQGSRGCEAAYKIGATNREQENSPPSS